MHKSILRKALTISILVTLTTIIEIGLYFLDIHLFSKIVSGTLGIFQVIPLILGILTLFPTMKLITEIMSTPSQKFH